MTEKKICPLLVLPGGGGGKNDVVKSAHGPGAFSVSETTSSNRGTTNQSIKYT